MNCTLLERLQCVIDLLEEAKIDALKCESKGNKTAGVRLRKSCQIIREELKQLRAEVQQINKESD
jgi:hypothetical protein